MPTARHHRWCRLHRLARRRAVSCARAGRSTSSTTSSQGKRENVPAGATFHELDIRDREAGDARSATLQADVLVHLAAQMDVRKSVEDPVFDASINVLGSLNLLEAVRGTSPKTRVVFASTGGAIYGDFTTPPNVENFEKDPESPYAIAKLAVELYLAYYGRVHGLEYGRAALRQRVRTAAGSARRGGRRRDLLRSASSRDSR